MAITGVHTLIYSDDPAATRAFCRDVLRWGFVSEGADGDAGVGGEGTGSADASDWLIFGTGPSELGVHPTSTEHGGQAWTTTRHHEISLMCDDLAATMSEITSRGGTFTSEARDMGFGIAATLAVPGADDILLYEPRHAVAAGR